MNLGDIVVLSSTQAGFQCQMRKTNDCIHGRADFVTHIGEKQRLCAHRIFRFLLRQPQLLSLFARVCFIHPKSIPHPFAIDQLRLCVGIYPTDTAIDHDSMREIRGPPLLDRLLQHRFYCCFIFRQCSTPASLCVCKNFGRTYSQYFLYVSADKSEAALAIWLFTELEYHHRQGFRHVYQPLVCIPGFGSTFNDPLFQGFVKFPDRRLFPLQICVQ